MPLEESWSTMASPSTHKAPPPRSLLLMLEEERTKNLHLETEVHQLKTEVEKNQAKFKSKIQHLQQQKHQELEKLQHQIDAKHEECMQLAKKLGLATTKHADDVLLWSGRTEKLDANLANTQGLLHQMETKLSKQEKEFAESQKQRQQLHAQLVKCEGVLAKHVQKMKEKELKLQKEKETRMQLQVKVLELEHQLTTRSEELQRFQSLNQQYHQLQQEKLQLVTQIEHLKQQQTLDATQRKCLTEDLDKLTSKERQVRQAMEEQTLSLQKLEHELERVQSQFTHEKEDHAQTRETLTQAQLELQTWVDRQSQWTRERSSHTEKEKRVIQQCQQAEKEATTYKTKWQDLQQLNATLEAQVAQLTTKLDQKETQMQTLQQEKHACLSDWHALQSELQNTNQAYQATETVLTNERKAVIELKSFVKELQDELQVKQQKIHHLEQQLKDTQDLLHDTQALVEKVQKEHQLAIHHHHQASDTFQSRISALEASLMEKSLEKQRFQSTEQHLGEVVQQREELITGLSDQIRHLETKVAQLRPLRDQVTEFEVQLMQRKEELVALEKQKKEAIESKESLEQMQAKLRLECQSKDHTIQLLKMELEATKKSVTRLKDDLAKSHRLHEFRQQLRPSRPPSNVSKHYELPPPLPPSLMDFLDSDDLEEHEQETRTGSTTTIDGMDEFLETNHHEQRLQSQLETKQPVNMSSLNPTFSSRSSPSSSNNSNGTSIKAKPSYRSALPSSMLSTEASSTPTRSLTPGK